MRLGGIFIERNQIVVARTDEDEALATRHDTYLSPDAIDGFETLAIQMENEPTIPMPQQRREIMEALGKAGRWIANGSHHPFGVGVACYGPFESVDQDNKHQGYGRLFELHGLPLYGCNLYRLTQKLFENANPSPAIAVQTDAAACALGEALWRSTMEGQGRTDLNSILAYLLVDAGIGGSFVRRFELWSGRHHPEMGQIAVFPHPKDPFKKGAVGPAGIRFNDLATETLLRRRLGVARGALRDTAPFAPHVIDLQAFYIAQLCAAVRYAIAPSMIVLGGAMMQLPNLLEGVRAHLADFLQSPDTERKVSYSELNNLDTFIDISALPHAGALGALSLAAEAYRRQKRSRQ